MDKDLMGNIESIGRKETWEASLAMIQPSVQAAVSWLDARDLRHVILIGNGSSLYAGYYGAMLLEELCGLPVTLVEGANSLYTPENVLRNALVIGLSNSGESPTVCEGVRRAKALGSKTLSFSGWPDSTLAGLSDVAVTFHGKTDNVPTKTKSYIETLITLHCFADALAKARGLPGEDGFVMRLEACRAAAEGIVAQAERRIKPLSERYASCPSFTLLGTGWNMATVYEGALKVTEIGWIDAKGFELENYMHGRFRGASPSIPYIVLAPKGMAFRYAANFLALARRKGIDTIIVTDETDPALHKLATHVVCLEGIPERLTPFVYPVVLYLFALYLGLAHGKEKPSDRGGDPQAQKVSGEDIAPELSAYFARLKESTL